MNKEEMAKRLASLHPAAIREGLPKLISNKKGRERHHLALPFPQKGQNPLLWKYPATHTSAQGNPRAGVLRSRHV